MKAFCALFFKDSAGEAGKLASSLSNSVGENDTLQIRESGLARETVDLDVRHRGHGSQGAGDLSGTGRTIHPLHTHEHGDPAPFATFNESRLKHIEWPGWIRAMIAVFAGSRRADVALLWVVVVVRPTPVNEAATRGLQEATEYISGRALLPRTVAMTARVAEFVSVHMRLTIATRARNVNKTPAKLGLFRLGISTAILRRPARRLALSRSVNRAIATGAAIVLLEI